MAYDNPQWCNVRQTYCRCPNAERCDRFDRDTMRRDMEREIYARCDAEDLERLDGDNSDR
jgi:hypothetical protein